MSCSLLRDGTAVRQGIHDIWNAFMLRGALFDKHDIPFCPTRVSTHPTQLVSWPEAKRNHNKAMRKGDGNYHVSAYIHFYVDDSKFDGVRSSVWLFPWKALEIIRHYDGVITPDFSMCQDFPEPLKIFAVFRMRAFGFWIGCLGLDVINNVRWGTEETWDYCFSGIEKNSTVAVGSVASGLRCLKNRSLFNRGLTEMVDRLRPIAIVVYGSANYECFKALEAKGIKILQFESETSRAFKRMAENE